MHKKLFFTSALLLLPLFATTHLLAQNRAKLYPYTMDVVQHPDYFRHYVKAPGDSVFGNKVHFISLRNLTGERVKERIDLWVNKLKLGDILWPAYPMIYEKNLKETVAEIKRQKLFLFDLYGYIPGSGPGGYWQQYVIPAGVTELFATELGDHWLGMDNGEQDGRYIGSFAPRLYPKAANRKEQYFSFQNFFEEMGNQLGNRMATLVSLNYGHYFLKEGLYTLIGAETAQGLPNSQVYYSFIRGAGKQYGVHWFGNASIYNRWGWKTYDPTKEADAGPTKGTSLSLLKRLMYTQLFYNCTAVGFESSMTIGKDKLSPLGIIQQQAAKWNERYGNLGAMYTPVALLHDFYAGWTFPRHFYSDDVYRVWGNLPYADSDYLTDGLLNLIYPGYQDASYYRDERGFIAPTPYGDVADCLLSDAPIWLLRQYPVVIVADELQHSAEVKDKLEAYVEAGGRLVITAGSLRNMPEGLFGITAQGNDTISSTEVVCGNRNISEGQPFALARLCYPQKARVISRCGKMAAAVELSSGKGSLLVLASPFGVGFEAQKPLPVRSHTEKPLDQPYPLLKHVEALVGNVLSEVKLFDIDADLSWTVDVKNRNEYNIVITNSQWKPVSFTIKSLIGRIRSIKELKTDKSEVTAVGYTPEIINGGLGEDNNQTIAGGAVRTFHIVIDNPTTTVMPQIEPEANNTGCALVVRNIKNLKEEVLSRPTFFQHYDRMVVDWRYLEERESEQLRTESGWIKKQKLGISVDLTSGLNLYPDLRIVANDSIYYPRSMNRMRRIIDKMAILGADELIVTSQRIIENNFTMDKFRSSLVESLRSLSEYAGQRGIRLLFRPSYERYPSDLKGIADLCTRVNHPNLYLAPSMAELLATGNELNEEKLELLKTLNVKYLFVAASQTDINGQPTHFNMPISKVAQPNIAKILKAVPHVHYIMDGLYASPDEEYLDLKALHALTKE